MRPQNAAALGVALIALLAFLPSLTSGFVLDDLPLIARNEYVHAWRWLPRAFTTHFWDVGRLADTAELRAGAEVHRYYRPLVTVSYLVTWVLVGAAPWAFHLSNVVLHAVTSGLATRAALRWTSSLRLALGVGLLFALHPTRTENVIWISGRTDVLMLLFVLLSLEGFAAFERRRSAGGAGPWRWLLVAFAALVAALLSKEPAVMLPLLVLADRSRVRLPSRRSWLVPASTVALASTYLLGRLLLWTPFEEAGRVFTPRHALLTVGLYAQRAIAPWPPSMYFYALEAGDGGAAVYPAARLLIGALVLALGATLLVVAWRSSRTAFWLLVAAVCFMGPLLNVTFTGMTVSAEDRFLYAPLLFASAALATLFRAPLRRLARRRAALLVLAGGVLGAFCMVQVRTLDYRSDRTFWEAEHQHSPTHPKPLMMLAATEAERGEVAEAYRYLSRAAQPDARRYMLAADDRQRMNAHFQRAVFLAALLPDGRAEDLGAVLDELFRLVEPTRVPRRRAVLDFPVGEPLPDAALARLVVEQAFAWEIAFVATRLGAFELATRVVDSASQDELAVSTSPLNGVLVLLRLGRYAEARAVHARLHAHADDLLVDQGALGALARQLDRAERSSLAREGMSDPAPRALAEAVRLAELGAYLAALRVLEAEGLLQSEEGAELVTQLLVACRLEDAARAHAARHAGDEAARELVAGLAAGLPRPLAALPPAPGALSDALTAARSVRR